MSDVNGKRRAPSSKKTKQQVSADTYQRFSRRLEQIRQSIYSDSDRIWATTGGDPALEQARSDLLLLFTEIQNSLVDEHAIPDAIQWLRVCMTKLLKLITAVLGPVGSEPINEEESDPGGLTMLADEMLMETDPVSDEMEWRPITQPPSPVWQEPDAPLEDLVPIPVQREEAYLTPEILLKYPRERDRKLYVQYRKQLEASKPL